MGVPVVYQDNTSTITLATKGGGKYRNKYLLVRCASVKEHCDRGDVIVRYLHTKRMLADLLTKALQGALFRFLTRGIIGAS